MAFHPFRTFRRYQKPMFAVLAIICMFVFVLSIGTGGKEDFFSQIGELFGRSKPRGNEVATLDGKRVSREELERVRTQRNMANLFIASAVPAARDRLLEQLQTDIARVKGAELWPSIAQNVIEKLRNPDSRNAFMRIQSLQQTAQMAGSLMQFASAPGDAGQNDGSREEIDRLSKQIEAAAVSALTESERQIFRQLYFGGNLNDESLLDFMLWQRLADRLKIRLTDKDVQAAVARETLNALSPQLSAEIEKGLRNRFKEQYAPDKLVAAIAEEYRVRAAQAAVLGVPPDDLTAELFRRSQNPLMSGSTGAATPAANTPFDDWTFFRDQRTEIQVAMFPLPIDRYLADIKDQPPPDEIEKLYKQNKEVEPDPSSERPGFKQPQRVAVQWMSVRADHPYYRQGAARNATAQAAGQAANALAVGPDALWAVPGLVYDFRRQGEYEKVVAEFNGKPWDFGPSFQAQYQYRSKALSRDRPDAVAALLGQQLASAGTGGLPLSGLIALEGQAYVTDIRAAAQRLAANLTDTGEGLPGFAPLPLAVGLTPPPPNPAAVEAQLAKRAAEEETRQWLVKDLEDLRKHLTEKGKLPDRTEFAKALQGAVTPREAKTGGSAGPGSAFALKDDPGLKPLKDKYAEQWWVKDRDPLYSHFPEFFFADPTAEMTNPTRDPNHTWAVFAPAWYPTGTAPPAAVASRLELDQPIFLVWKTEDEKAKVVPLDAVRPQVVEAWRRQKARERAEAEAKRLAEEAKALKGNYPAVKDLAARNGVTRPFVIGPIARQLVETGAQASVAPRYKQFTLDPNLIAYPQRQTVEELLKLKSESPGATEVVTDQPRSTFYVAYLISKDEPSETEFETAFFKGGGSSGLLEQLQQRSSMAYSNEVVLQLRKDFNLKVNTDALQKPGSQGPAPLEE
jgi:hypothetical protein